MKKVKNRKKILFLSRLYYPHIGGVEKHVAEVSKILVKKGFSVTVICEQYDKKLKTKEQINKVEVLRIPISLSDKNKKFEIWKWVLRNRKFIKSFDIVHIHDVFFWIMPILFYLDRKKIFITFHGYESYPLMTSSKIQKKFAAKYCKGSIAVGDFINKWYGIASNAVIYGAADGRIILSKPKRTSKTPLNILYMGRLSRDMGADIYIEALFTLRKANFKFNLEICGDGEYRSRIEKFGKVRGFVNNLDSYISRADIVFSSSYLSMLEVLVQKKRIFAVFNNPLKEDYLKMSPFSKYISINSSSKELCKSIIQNIFVADIEEGRKWAQNQSWENVVKTYKTIWNI